MNKFNRNETRLNNQVHHLKFSRTAQQLLKKSYRPLLSLLNPLVGLFRRLTNIGVTDDLKEETMQQARMVNAINLVLCLLILTIGGMFCWISARPSVIIPASLEFCSVLLVLYFNYKQKHNQAAWLTYIGQFSAVIYFSLLLRDILDVNAMVFWMLSLVFVIFPGKRSRVAVVFAALATFAVIRFFSYQPPVFVPIEVGKTAAILLKESAFVGVFILNGVILAFYAISRDANPKLNAQNKVQSLMVKTATHEVRNPYHQQYASAQMILRCLNLKQIDKAKYYAQLLIDSNRQAMSFLDNVIELSRIEAGEQRYAARDLFSLPELLSKYEQLCGPLAAQHELKLKVQTDFFPAAIYSDQNRVWHIVNNLVGNAINHAHNRSTITIQAHISRASYVLEVINDGPTIPQNVLSNIFDAFLTSEKKGGGLGLYLVKDAVTLMKGTIVMSSENERTRVTVSLPLEIGNAKDLPEEQAFEQREALDLSKVRVYVVDDNKMNCLLLERILGDYGCIVNSYGSATQLLDALKFSIPEMIILDVNMPTIDGYETLKILKSDMAYRHIPVIMATGDAMKESTEKAIKLGAMACMIKPFLIQDLESNLAQALRLTMTTEMSC